MIERRFPDVIRQMARVDEAGNRIVRAYVMIKLVRSQAHTNTRVPLILSLKANAVSSLSLHREGWFSPAHHEQIPPLYDGAPDGPTFADEMHPHTERRHPRPFPEAAATGGVSSPLSFLLTRAVFVTSEQHKPHAG